MSHEYSTRALVELMQIGKPPSGADPVLQHAPEALKRIEVVTAVGRQEMQPKLLVPVCQRRRELFRPGDATVVGDQDHLFAGVAKEGHHLMDILASLNFSHFVARKIWRGCSVSSRLGRAYRLQRRESLQGLLMSMDPIFNLLQTAIN